MSENQNRMTKAFSFAQYASELRHFMARSLAGDVPSERASGVEFEPLALDLFALQFEENPAYRKLCEAQGASPASVSRWDDIPAVPTLAFKELELTCLPEIDRTTVFHSSGTTGRQPSRHYHNGDSLALYDASLALWFQIHLLPEWGRAGEGRRDGARSGRLEACPALNSDAANPDGHLDFLVLTPPAHEAPHSSLVHMFETVIGKFGSPGSMFCGAVGTDGAWSLDQTRAESFLRESGESGRSVAVMGTAFNFVHLLDTMAAGGRSIQLPPGSRALETGGYKGRSRQMAKSELHSLITTRLGIQSDHIVSEYGMSELSSQAYDHSLSSSRNTQHATRLFHFPPWARAQVISPENRSELREGETGLLRIFDLANVRSALAIQTEDLAIRRAGGFELLGRSAAAEPRGCSLMAVNS